MPQWGIKKKKYQWTHPPIPAKKDGFKISDRGKYSADKNKLNNRSRKCLGFKTPNPLFSGLTYPLHLELEFTIY
jgi:hypothetical protein